MPRSRSASFDTYNDVYPENDDPYYNENLKGGGSDRRSASSRSRSRDRSSSRSRSKSRGRHRSPSRSRSRERDREGDRRRSLSEKAVDQTSFAGMLDFTSIPSTGHHDLLRASWDTVFYNKDNFDAWTDLLTKVEQLNDINAARDVFEPFLIRYPYCYGYWRKYAEFERRSGNLEKAMSVWERSVSAIPLCIDLWLPFLAFFRELALHAEGGLEKTREIMERAMMSAGMEYNSDRLWADVIQFELAQNNPRRVMVLYERLLGIPTALHVQQFEKFQLFVNSFEPNEILDEEEYRDIFSKVKKAVDIGVEQMIVDERIALATNGSGAPGDEQYIVKRRHVPEVLRVFREEIIARRRALHLETAGQVMKRAPFEEKIKRPYFHVKPLDPLEFENWRQYLDMEIDAAKDSRVIVLFERCLIATALYDEFWIKYARWRWRRSGDEGAARSVFQRAVTVHCRKKPVVHLAYSAFEESVGG